MQVYFLKATYTNNVYKLSDFFLLDEYKLDSGKMLDINFKPDDGLSSFTTKNIMLPDGSSIRDHTHVIIPEFGKIYRVSAIDYLNVDQYMIILDEDPMIGNYQELKDEDIIMHRINDPEQFRGINDISDITLKETVSTKIFSSPTHTGKWALIFMQVDPDVTRYGLKFKAVVSANSFEQFTYLASVKVKYPEVETETPELYPYYQKIVNISGAYDPYQCVWGSVGGVGKLYWMKYNQTVTYLEDVYFGVPAATGARFVASDIQNIIIALPFESTIKGSHDTNDPNLLSFQSFIGPITSGQVIDIKIVDDIVLPFNSVSYTIDTTASTIRKTLSTANGGVKYLDILEASPSLVVDVNYQLLSIVQLKTIIDLDPEIIDTDPIPTDAEPFKKYDLYIYGKKFSVPYYLTDDLHLMIAVNSGVINYLIYYNDPRNIIGAGSMTHSIRYQVDGLDSFYNLNPTYKDQFFLKMGADSVKTVSQGAIGGSVIPGIGTLLGAGLGIASAGVDAGLSLVNLHYQEKSLKLKPEQIFGDISEISLQLLNIFGIYMVTRTSGNADLMLTEYGLRGFPIEKVMSISDLDYSTSFFGTSKIVYGELKKVIKNEYTTGFINLKLKEGLVFIE